MTETEDYGFALTGAAAKATAAGAWNRIVAIAMWLDECLETRHQRRALRLMDAHLLKDIGLSRADVERETSRGFWDVGKR